MIIWRIRICIMNIRNFRLWLWQVFLEDYCEYTKSLMRDWKDVKRKH